MPRDAVPPADGGSSELDRLSPVPLYHQLERALLEFIVVKRLEPDARLPSESELCARFGVTRPTVRQALDRLVQVGVLRRERGRGTYLATVPTADVGIPMEDRPTVKVVMPSLNELIHLHVLAGIVDEARLIGLQVVLAHSDGSGLTQERELESAAGLAGVLLWPVAEGGHSPALARLDAAGQPIVFIDRYTDSHFDRVVVDNERGAADMVDHLADLGHRRIAFFHTEPIDLSSVRYRLAGYRGSLGRHGFSYDERLVVQVDTGPGGSIEDVFTRLRALPDPPTAVFCVNDVLAVRTFMVLRAQGVEVPGDMSVAGFDAVEVLPAARTLTSVRRETEVMGHEAVRLIAGRIRRSAPSGEPRRVVLPTSLVVGDTTGAPRARHEPDVGTEIGIA